MRCLLRLVLAALMEKYPNLSPIELEISEELAAEVRRAPSSHKSASTPREFVSATCLICVDNTRRTLLSNNASCGACAGCPLEIQHTVGASTQPLDTELRYRMFKYGSGRTEATSRCYMEFRGVDGYILDQIMTNAKAQKVVKLRRPRSLHEEKEIYCLVDSTTVCMHSPLVLEV